MKKLFEILNKELEAGNDVVMVSVTASSGSTPRGAGARMIIGEGGRLYGTIGGGAVEYRCEERAREVLKTKKSFNQSYMLRKNQVEDLGMICGGDVEVFFQFIPADDSLMKEAVSYAIEQFNNHKDIWIITDITDNKEAGLAIYSEKKSKGMEVTDEIIEHLKESPFKKEIGGRMICAEKINESELVYIFGGGHVAQQLVPTLSRVNFNCIVIEDREEFANKGLFEGVLDTRLVDMNKLDDVCKDITSNDYICVMTRGHANDYEVEKHALRTPAKYIGVIGSRRKIAGVNERLRADGFNDQDLKRITTPIGLEIQAETPAEIAVSIAAQMISERAKTVNK